MSSALDPAKLKVVELRAELTKRGLDSKGNKPALVKRLKEALEEELKQELPDTSIADTSTEDLDSSQTQDQAVTEESDTPDKEPEESNEECKLPQKEISIPDTKTTETVTKDDHKLETVDPTSAELKTKETECKPQRLSELITDESLENQEENNANLEENKENGEQDESKSRKSRWSSGPDDIEPMQQDEQTEHAEATESSKTDKDAEPKGEKRRRSSPSPDRSQRRRSKSPIKEDEPPIDKDKVQLNWYDSDLHLQVDKESFLSAKPYHEGAFGFAWAGVRATHGVNTGKVCFEVKITEELKWEDFSKYYDKHRREQHKTSTKQKHDDDKKKNEPASKDKDVDKKKDEPVSKEKDDDKKDEPALKDKDDESESKSKEDESESKSKEDESESKSKEDETKSDNGQPENANKAENDEDHDIEMKDVVASETAEVNKKKITEDTSKTEEPKSETINTVVSQEQTEDQEQTEVKELQEPLPTHLFRVGWSLLDSGLQLGEDKHSYGFESSGRFVVNKEFTDYGTQFGVGDVITSFLNISENGISISYAVNGVPQSEALSIPLPEVSENLVFFPHILSRNYAFELNLGSQENSWFPLSESYKEYQFLDKIENKVAGPVRPENRSDCEVILMCGLPASGKTHWVREHVQSNPDKQYTVLGNSHLLEKMTVSGNAFKTKYQGSWNILLEKLQKCINKLVEIAALRRRNYIIDQPNVYPSAQRRKLRPFEGFKRRAVVVVVGDEEQAKRQSLQEAEGGKDVPDNIVLDMKANMSLPQKGDWIDEVIYAGVDEEEAKTLIQKYNSQARETIGIQRRFGHRDDRHRWQNRRNDYRGGNYRDRNYQNNRYDRGLPRQGNWHPQRPGGWNRDRRDHRGPPAMTVSRDWRNRGNNRERGNRDSHGQGNNYNRNRNQLGRGPGGNWPASWSQNQGSWGNQPWGQGSWGQGGWGGQSNQNQWKYGGGSQSYGNYSNWNYYGQYPQNWGSQQGQAANAAGANQYGQYSQQDWAQYAQQYAQQGQTTATTQSTPQK